MFLARRPTRNFIDRFIRESQDLPLSYGPVGIVSDRDLHFIDTLKGVNPLEVKV